MSQAYPNNTGSLRDFLAPRGLTLATVIGCLRGYERFPQELLPSVDTTDALRKLYILDWQSRA